MSCRVLKHLLLTKVAYPGTAPLAPGFVTRGFGNRSFAPTEVNSRLIAGPTTTPDQAQVSQEYEQGWRNYFARKPEISQANIHLQAPSVQRSWNRYMAKQKVDPNKFRPVVDQAESAPVQPVKPPVPASNTTPGLLGKMYNKLQDFSGAFVTGFNNAPMGKVPATTAALGKPNLNPQQNMQTYDRPVIPQRAKPMGPPKMNAPSTVSGIVSTTPPYENKPV